MGDRNLTDDDGRAIVGALKEEVYRDFKIEVANGILGYVQKALLLILILLAIQGMTGDKSFLNNIAQGRAT